MPRIIRIAMLATVVVTLAGFAPRTAHAQAASTGFSLRGNSGGLFFNMFGRQANTRSVGSVAGSVTVGNGQSGYFADGALVPFVTDVIPVVGDQPHLGKVVGPLPYGERMTILQERLARMQAEGESPGSRRRTSPRTAEASGDESGIGAGPSSAAQPAASLAEIRRGRTAAGDERAREARHYFEQGEAAQREGNAALARYYYQLAHRRSEGELHTRAAAKLAELAK
jgi:hypothetical protein